MPFDFQFAMPQNILDAKTPEERFRAAATHFEPVAVGMLGGDPFRGGPVLGFVLHPSEKLHVVLNGFAVLYYGMDDERQKTQYLSFDELHGHRPTLFNAYVEQGLRQKEAKPWAVHTGSDAYPPMLVFHSPPASPTREVKEEEP